MDMRNDCFVTDLGSIPFTSLVTVSDSECVSVFISVNKQLLNCLHSNLVIGQ